MNDKFRILAAELSQIIGSVYIFLLALCLVIAWFIGGFIFGFGDTYQIFINTGTTIVTFLMVFLIQNSANRDSKAIHLKLDELLLAQNTARNEMITVEKKSEEEIKELDEDFANKAEDVNSTNRN